MCHLNLAAEAQHPRYKGVPAVPDVALQALLRHERGQEDTVEGSNVDKYSTYNFLPLLFKVLRSRCGILNSSSSLLVAV